MAHIVSASNIFLREILPDNYSIMIERRH